MNALIRFMNFSIEIVSETDDEGVFAISPLPTGFGYTLGNVMRRTLLSSIKGAAISEVRISDVPHQFTTIEGVKEDVIQFVLNLKKVRVKLLDDKPVVLKLEAKGIKDVKAKDFTPNPSVIIANPDCHLLSLTAKKTIVEAQLLVEPGYGYVAREALEYPKIGVLPVDSIFSPVIQATYKVEETRVGETTNLDKLVMTIKTDGTVKPGDALKETAGLLTSYFARISGQKVTEDRLERADLLDGDDEDAENVGLSKKEAEIALEDLDLPLRTVNSLKRAKIETLGELYELGEEELLGIRGLGETSVAQVKDLMETQSWR